MAARRKADIEVDVLVEDWISVNRDDDKTAWQAWTDWRRAQLRVVSESNSLTVPTPFPPATIAAAKEYAAILKQIRSSIGWKDSRAKLPTDFSAWAAPPNHDHYRGIGNGKD